MGFFAKFCFILSWDINLNPGPVHEIQNKNLLYIPPLHDFSFSGDDFDHNVHSFSKNVCRSDWDVFKKE